MFTENLPDAGKAQDFMKKFNQVLGEDEKLRVQLEVLISPTCSCKQAEICVVRGTLHLAYTLTHRQAASLIPLFKSRGIVEGIPSFSMMYNKTE